MKKRRQTSFKEGSISEENRQHILDILKEEGFTEEQLNEMALEKVWKLYLDSVGEFFSREMGLINKSLEENPQLISILNPLIKQPQPEPKCN